MKNSIIFEILNDMVEELTVSQLKKLQEVLLKRFDEEEKQPDPANNEEYLEMFINAKRIEGCSPRTLKYYRTTIEHLFSLHNLPVRKMNTDLLRQYLTDYQKINNCGKSTVDNIRRNLSSFFSNRFNFSRTSSLLSAAIASTKMLFTRLIPMIPPENRRIEK